MALSQQTLEDLDSAAWTAVYAGYEPLEEIRAGLLELIEDDPATEAEVAVDRDAAVQAVDEIVTRHADAHTHEQESFSTPTDPERLSALFEQLDRDGIVARENVGYTQGDLSLEMWELLDDRPDGRGWVGFHGQDLERVVHGGVLFLAYAHRSDRDEDFAVIAREVADRARDAGFDVHWDGDPKQRIELRGLRWQRRRG